MSTYENHTLACPNCAHAFSVPLLKGMHITRIPEVRDQILRGTFQLFACADCGQRVQVEKATVYTDFDRGHYVAVEPAGRREVGPLRAVHQRVFDQSFLLGPDIAEEMSQSMTHRLVFGLVGLREKLLAWDAGLDDRVLEALKLDALVRLGLDRKQWQLRLLAVLPPGGHLLFGRYPVVDRSGDGPVRVVPTPKPVAHHSALRSAYDDRLRRWRDLRATYPWLGDDWLVDGSLGAPASA